MILDMNSMQTSYDIYSDDRVNHNVGLRSTRALWFYLYLSQVTCFSMTFQQTFSDHLGKADESSQNVIENVNLL